MDRNGDALVSGDARVSVALRKESVDRNVSSFFVQLCDARRSPQGERG